jgi:hypothetical protein
MRLLERTHVSYQPSSEALPGAAAQMKHLPYIQTATGQRINPFAPAPEEIEIVDIAHALANQCRFAGHSRVFYSVAQHSIHVAELLSGRTSDSDTLLWGLLHDGAEAYLGDLSHPIKYHSKLGKSYRSAERELQRVICERFRLPYDPPQLLREVDLSLLAVERRQLMGALWPWPQLEHVVAADINIEPLTPQDAKAAFLARYRELTREGDRAAEGRPMGERTKES